MRNKYRLLIMMLPALLIAACSQAPTGPVVEEETPNLYVPVWDNGKSVVLSFTWIDTSGNGDVVYSGSGVSMSGRVDSVWFNFPDRCEQEINFSITADSIAAGTVNSSITGITVVYEGYIASGHYSYGFEVNQLVEHKSTYAVRIISAGSMPAPVMAYMRIVY
jgi:hypothetical protein